MTLLSRDQDRYVFLVTPEEHALMLDLLSLPATLLGPRKAQTLSKGAAANSDENRELNRSLNQNRRQQAALVKRLLKNKTTCVPTESGFGLTVAPSEFEAMLQALNNVNIRAWEGLGCPDFESGERFPVNVRNLLLFRLLGQTNMMVSILLEALNE